MWQDQTLPSLLAPSSETIMMLISEIPKLCRGPCSWELAQLWLLIVYHISTTSEGGVCQSIPAALLLLLHCIKLAKVFEQENLICPLWEGLMSFSILTTS